MQLAPGSTLGSYEIVAPLGKGGMGEVYRARDTKLEREVAIKVLPADFADLGGGSKERLARFEREAKTLAALNHPNIATVHGFEREGDTRFLVMELAAGEDLSDRLQRGPIPVPEAIDLFFQIAEGLEAAHSRGIVHRDLKPANIKIDTEGKVKILDFGLAKVSEPAAPATEDLSQSPTLTVAATAHGVILGTAAYMSPEQASGQPVDERSDIWSFGVCFYEALTGRRAFEAKDVSNTLAAVLRDELDFGRLPAGVPPAIRKLLKRCLRREVRQRLQSIGDARLELAESAADSIEEEQTASPSRRLGLLLLTGLFGVILGGLAVGVGTRGLQRSASIEPSPARRLTLRLPSSQELFMVQAQRTVEVTADGSTVFYFGAKGESSVALYRRALNEVEPVLFGSVNIVRPFVSPDGEWIASFQRSGGLAKLPLVEGGTPVVVCSSCAAQSGAWGSDGKIYFLNPSSGEASSPGSLGGETALWSVSADGGSPSEVVRLDADDSGDYRYLRILPGERTFLATQSTDQEPGEPRVVAFSSENGKVRTLVEQGSDARYSASGHLIFARNASLVAAPFDVQSLEILGPPISVIDRVRTTFQHAADYTLANDGTLLYVTHDELPEADLVRVERNGRIETFSEGRRFVAPRVSPRGDRILVSVKERGEAEAPWLYDLARSTLTRVAQEASSRAIWSPVGESLTLASRPGTVRFYRIGLDGGSRQRLDRGDDEPLPTSGSGGTLTFAFASSWSPDGKVLAFNNGFDIFTLTPGDEPEFRAFAATPFLERAPMFSPDGRFVAYDSNESGRFEVYVRAFDGSGEKIQISTEGGHQAVWSRDGRELFYRNGDRLMAVRVETSPRFVADQPQLLFVGDYELGGPGFYANYDVMPDGQSFVMVRSKAGPPREIQVVLNFDQELKRLAPVE